MFAAADIFFIYMYKNSTSKNGWNVYIISLSIKINSAYSSCDSSKNSQIQKLILYLLILKYCSQ